MNTPNPTAVDVEFTRFAGELAESFNFSRSIGQIYGLLYISPGPLSLGEICERLSMSKGNASINLRLLEFWGAVRPVSVMGSRKDFYEPNRDLKDLALRRLREGMGKRLDFAESQMARFSGNGNGKNQ